MARKATFYTAVLAAGFTLALAEPVLAREATANTWLNVRAGPGTAYSVVDTLSPRQHVSFNQDECTRAGWCYVRWAGTDGWVNSSYLTFDRSGWTDPARPGPGERPGWPPRGPDRPGGPGGPPPGGPGWPARPGSDGRGPPPPAWPGEMDCHYEISIGPEGLTLNRVCTPVRPSWR